MRAEAKITFTSTFGLVLVFFLASGGFAQEPRRPTSAQTAIRVQSETPVGSLGQSAPDKATTPWRCFMGPRNERFHIRHLKGESLR
jgi:hypothetical protein